MFFNFLECFMTFSFHLHDLAESDKSPELNALALE
jgi:hypothetical protein